MKIKIIKRPAWIIKLDLNVNPVNPNRLNKKVKCDQVGNLKKILHHIARTNPIHFDSMNDWSESSFFKRTDKFLVR